MCLRGPAQTASQWVHDRLQHDHQQAEGELPDAHPGWGCRVGAGGQFGPLLWRHHVQVWGHATPPWSDRLGSSLLGLSSDLLFLFSVRPPKKSWKKIFNLSGGEKTLSSLALVFALHHYKPTPLYFMDEIDAALDFKNVSIVACYIYVSVMRLRDGVRWCGDGVLNVWACWSLQEQTKNAQFIIISLRNNMFEIADRLIGIYKTHNTTKSVGINPKIIVFKEHDAITAWAQSAEPARFLFFTL